MNQIDKSIEEAVDEVLNTDFLARDLILDEIDKLFDGCSYSKELAYFQMDEVFELLGAGFDLEALDYVRTKMSPNSEPYLFCLAAVQGSLGWTEEAMHTLTKFKSQVEGTDLEGTAYGFLADILHNEGYLSEAVLEISNALKVEPDCPLIQKTAKDIYDDWNDFFEGVILTIMNLVLKRTFLKFGHNLKAK